MKKYIFLCIAMLMAVFFFIGSVRPSYAFTSLLNNSENAVYSSGCISEGNCELNDFVVLAVRVSQIILSLTGSLSLLALIYGGVLFLISAGNTEQVSKGKRVIFYAVIGIAIVFFSYTIIAFIYKTLGISGNPFKVF